MCLSGITAHQYKRKKNWIVGYKILRWEVGRNGGWVSQHSHQKWEFAKQVKAVDPKFSRFTGQRSPFYENGIHAWQKLKYVIREETTDPTVERIVKVLLFGVTHRDSTSYRADAAIIIEVLDEKTGKRISW